MPSDGIAKFYDVSYLIIQIFSYLVNFMVVLIGLVIIFKKQITTLLENIFKEINSQSKEVY